MPASAAWSSRPGRTWRSSAGTRRWPRRWRRRARPAVVTVTPEMVQTEQGWRLTIPAEAGYGGSVFEVLDAPAI